MNNLNNVNLSGNLVRDAELKYTRGDTAVANFAIAVNYTWGEREEVYFFDVEMYGKVAENLVQYLTKGKSVIVSGRLQQQRWDSDGQSRSKVVVVANFIQLLGGGGERASEPVTHSTPTAPQIAGPEAFDDDIPF